MRIEGFTPGIITQAQHERVQEQVGLRQARHNAKQPRLRYLLTGLIRCSKCGTRVCGASVQRQNRYYRCRATQATSRRPARCHEPYIRADALESLVWSKVTATIKDPAVLIADLEHHLSTGKGDLGAKMGELRREIDGLKSQQRRLIELRQMAVIDLDMLESQLAPVRALCDDKEASLRLLEEQQTQQDDAAEAGRRIAQYCETLAGRLVDLDFDGQRATLAAFGVGVEATREELAITVVVDPNVTTIEHTLASSPNWRYTSYLRVEPWEWPVYHKPGNSRAPRGEPRQPAQSGHEPSPPLGVAPIIRPTQWSGPAEQISMFDLAK